MIHNVIGLIVYESCSKLKLLSINNAINDIRKIKCKNKVYIIDLSKYYFFKKNFNINCIKKYKFIRYFKVNSIKELVKFGDNNNVLCLGPIKLEIKFIIIYFLIKLSKIKRIYFNRYGQILEFNSLKNYRIKDGIRFFFFEKLSYWFMRILAMSNIIANVDYYLEASQNMIDKINNKTLKRFFPNLSYYKKIYRINSLWFDELKKNKNKNKNKKIYTIFVDPGIDHPDRYLRGETITERERQNYYLKVFNFLNFLKKNNHNVVFSKHPKSIYFNKSFNIFYKKFKVINSLNYNYFIKSKILILGPTTIFNRAITHNKIFIFFKTSELGSYMNDRLSYVGKIFKFSKINLDQKIFDLKSIDYTHNRKIYEKFKKNNILNNKKYNSYEQIKKIIEKIFKYEY